MPSTSRRHYGLLPKRLRSSRTALRSNSSMYNSVPTLTGDLPDNAGREPASHLRLAYMADIPKPWTDTIPERWCDQMPEHWCTPQEPVQRIIFMLLCMGALGQFQMVQLWDACRNEETFRARKESFTERLTTITVVAGLLLSSMASFVTTEPPLPHIINYNIRGAYHLLLYAFSGTLSVIIIGSAILYAMSEMKRDWVMNTLLKTRANIYCFLIIMGYPFAGIGLATSAAVIGLLIAAFKSHDTLAKVGGVFTVLIPASMAPVYLFSLRYSRRRKEPVDGTGSTKAADRTRDQVNGEYKEEEDTRENTV